MSSSFEKSVKGATKIKAAPPKTKYIEHILIATHAGEAGVGEVFRALQFRLRDSTWTVVFKSLITIHLMIREGSPDSTLAYLARHRNMLAISNFTDAQIQGRNIRHYAAYLQERVRAFKDTKTDWVRAKETRLEKLSVEKGLLRETEAVQSQMSALLKCDVLDETENEITITVFRLLVLDLLALFQVVNQAMINILGHFFEMSKTDAERAMGIYRTFTRQTDYVVQYLSVARQWEHHTRVEVPKLKHAPVNLGRQLEDYLKDPDFEIHRRQYLAELDSKKGGSGSGVGKSTTKTATPAASDAAKRLFGTTDTSSAAASSSKPPQANKGPEPDLIDFFDSIEQNQTTLATEPTAQTQMPAANVGNPWPTDNNSAFAMQQPQPQQPNQFQVNGLMPHPTGFAGAAGPYQQQNPTPFGQPQQQQQPLQQVQSHFTGAGFGGFTPQPSYPSNNLAPIPQNTVSNFQTGTASSSPMQTGQPSTNPFRLSTMIANPTGSPASNTLSPQSPPMGNVQRHSTNPFARSSPQAVTPFPNPAQTTNNTPFQSPSPQPQLQPTPTGTNPFAKNFGGSGQQQQPQQRPQTSAGLMAQPTGSNPFRQGAFVNHQTGMGWQQNQQPIGGGLDQIPTTQVFPRPAQQTPWQQ